MHNPGQTSCICGLPIVQARYRDCPQASPEPDYDPAEDRITWRHLNGYAACFAARNSFATPRPALVDAAHLARQREWSTETFGPGRRTKGVLDHIRKELGEIEADPTDVGEWVDVIILAFDGAWRAGWEPQQVLDAIAAKQTKNESRVWPDWRTMSEDQAIEHDRSTDRG